MAVQPRPMHRSDVQRCVELVAAHPVLGPRYGRVIADLEPAWLRLLECEAKRAIVFEDADAGKAEIWGIGVSVFVTDDFLRELKTPPFFWIGPELVKRTVRGNSPILSERQLREANSHGGLNLVVWEGYIRPDENKVADVSFTMMRSFVEEHAGYLWKEVIGAQGNSVDHMLGLLSSGGLLLNAEDGRYSKSIPQEPQKVVGQPHVIGLTRETALKEPGSWAGALFNYHPPRFGFNRSEQRLLLYAMAGATDGELSDRLDISLSTVKKTWLSAYSRVSACLPDLLPEHCGSDEWTVERGKEKKRRLVVYLREHPEELRPVSRKLLRQRNG